MTSNRSTDTDSTASRDTARPTYTHLDPSCPVCGNTRFADCEESIPNGYDAHHVHGICANCNTHLTIEYRAIDVSWFDGHDGHHSAVSQHRLEPMQTKYVAPEMYAPLPDTSALERLDWPRHCEDCNERLTGNDILTEPSESAQPDSDGTDSVHVVFRCPNCDHRSTGTTDAGP
jgi:hypothetical protein